MEELDIVPDKYDMMMDKFGENYEFFLRGPFGQWFKRKMTIDDVVYNCCEQYMMAQKALLFNSPRSYGQIMLASDPKDQKWMGRMIKGFVQSVWDDHARDIVYRGNYAKFTQHEDFKEKLLGTSGKLLVEANPRDDIWGIALDEYDPRRLKRATWRGKNWLGQVLTRVREDIIANANNESRD